MPIIHKQHYTPDACLNLFDPTERNKPALLKFFTEMPDSDLTGLYEQHQRHGHWIDLEHSWLLVFLNGDHAFVMKFLGDNRASNTLVDQYGRNIAHFAAWSGHAKCLFAVLEEYPKLKDSVNEYGSNIAHFAALSGHAECLFDVLEKYPKLKDSVNNSGSNIAHFAASSGRAECLFSVLDKYPKLKDSVNKYGRNIAHFAVLSGHAECLFAVLEKYPKLKDSVGKDGANIAHYAAVSNNEACLKVVLLRYPAWIASVEKPCRLTLATTLDIRRIVSDVKQMLEQQYLAAQQSESSLFDAHKPARVAAVSVPDAVLSEDAKTHIRERVKQQLEWLAEEGLPNRDVVRALQLLQQGPFDTTTQAGREKDKEFNALVAGKDFELKYDLMHPASMSNDIKPEQIESAREYLREVLASQEQVLLKEPEKSSSVASQGVFARLAVLPSPPNTEYRGQVLSHCIKPMP